MGRLGSSSLGSNGSHEPTLGSVNVELQGKMALPRAHLYSFNPAADTGAILDALGAASPPAAVGAWPVVSRSRRYLELKNMCMYIHTYVLIYRYVHVYVYVE